MKKIIAIIFLIISSTIIYISSSDQLIGIIVNNRYKDATIWGSDKYIYGDLYGMSYLSEFKLKEYSTPTLDSFNRKDFPNPRYLYVMHDSYFPEYLSEKPEYFYNVKKLNLIHWKNRRVLDLDSIKNNNSIILIECVERNAFNLINLKGVLDRISFSNKKRSNSFNKISLNSNKSKDMNSFDFNFSNELIDLKNRIFNRFIETNIEFLIFNIKLFSPFKIFKAEINQKLFGRINGDVYLSKNKKYLYLNETINKLNIGSSFYPLSENEIGEFVNNLNEINDYLLNKGFKKVIFNINPNPVAILKTEDFPLNHFVQRVKNHTNLRATLLDPSDRLKINADHNFFHSDSHWNSNGAKIWMTYFNEELKKMK